nr:hypothetical protein [Puia sp.]
FEKTIHIANPQLATNDTAVAPNRPPDIQFFPEGGDLVQDVKSTVGFRITDAWGKGLEATGSLVDDHDTLLRFSPLKMGLGHFSFTPAAGKTYRALIRFPDGREIVKALPPAHNAGYAMQLQVSASALHVQVRTKGITDGSPVYLMVHTRGVLKKTEAAKLQNGLADFSIASDIPGEGISEFTLFDSQGRPVCERLYFKYPDKLLQLGMSTNHSEFSTRRPVDLDIAATGYDGRPLVADLSMAVYRVDSLHAPDEMNISRYLYLLSDLGGTVESPGYYFSSDETAKGEAVDNLMLTHGWRRFNWADIADGKKQDIRYMPEYYGHLIEARILDSRTNAPLRDLTTYLSVPSTRTQFQGVSSDSTGHLQFEMKDFYGSQEIILQTDPRVDSNYRVEVESPFDQAPFANTAGYSWTGINDSLDLQDQDVEAQVSRVFEGRNRQQFEMPAMDTSAFYVRPDERYMLDDFTRFQTMEEVIREYVVSTNVVKKKDKLMVYVFEAPPKRFFSEEPLILLDGVPVFEGDKLFHHNPMKIKRLDLVSMEYFLGDQRFPGIISCITYHGDLDGFEMDPHAAVLDYPGMPGQRVFFSPEYQTEEQVNSRIPDFRTLLYWSPQIKTDSLGKENIHFYTSDLPGKYAAVLQGITADGQCGSQTIYFNVKK